MNILFVHETEYVEKVVFEYQIVPEILASRGHNVYVMDFPSNWKRKNIFDLGSLKTVTIPNVKKAGKEKGITLIRPGFFKIPVLSRLIAYVMYWGLIPKTLKKYDIDCIVMYSVPTNGMQTIRASRKLGIPIFFRLFDVLHEIVPFKILKPITYRLEQAVYKKVDAFAATTPKLRDYGIAMGAPKEKSYYLPTGSDGDLFYPTAKDKELVKKYAIQKSDTVIGFAGTLYNFSELDYLISYLSDHRKKLSHIKLLISGHGEQEETLKKMIADYSLEDQVILTGFIAYEKLAAYMNLADVCINLFDINDLTKDIIPGKIYQYLACGKPIVATRLPGMLNVFPEGNPSHPIFYCDEKDPAQFFKLVEKVKNTPFKDVEPNLQEITTEYEKYITSLVKKTS